MYDLFVVVDARLGQCIKFVVSLHHSIKLHICQPNENLIWYICAGIFFLNLSLIAGKMQPAVSLKNCNHPCLVWLRRRICRMHDRTSVRTRYTRMIAF